MVLGSETLNRKFGKSKLRELTALLQVGNLRRRSQAARLNDFMFVVGILKGLLFRAPLIISIDVLI